MYCTKDIESFVYFCLYPCLRKVRLLPCNKPTAYKRKLPRPRPLCLLNAFYQREDGKMKVIVSLLVRVSLCLCVCVFGCVFVCGLSDYSPATRATPMFVACIVSRGGGIGGKMKVLETHS